MRDFSSTPFRNPICCVSLWDNFALSGLVSILQSWITWVYWKESLIVSRDLKQQISKGMLYGVEPRAWRGKSRSGPDAPQQWPWD